MVSTAAFHARVRGSVLGLGGLKETKMFLPHPRVKVSIVGSLREIEVACSTSDRHGPNFQSCGWRTVSSQSSHHHPQEVLLGPYAPPDHCGVQRPAFVPKRWRGWGVETSDVLTPHAELMVGYTLHPRCSVLQCCAN